MIELGASVSVSVAMKQSPFHGALFPAKCANAVIHMDQTCMFEQFSGVCFFLLLHIISSFLHPTRGAKPTKRGHVQHILRNTLELLGTFFL